MKLLLLAEDNRWDAIRIDINRRLNELRETAGRVLDPVLDSRDRIVKPADDLDMAWLEKIDERINKLRSLCALPVPSFSSDIPWQDREEAKSELSAGLYARLYGIEREVDKYIATRIKKAFEAQRAAMLKLELDDLNRWW